MAPKTIPVLDMTADIAAHWDRYIGAIARVIRSGQFINGSEVGAFEREMAAYLGVAHAVGLNSGTDALTIGLRTLGVGPGDEVITTPFTFFATCEAILTVGAKPVFVDIEPETFNIDVGQIDKAVTPATKAIIPVHLFGQACAMPELLALARRRGLAVLEDVAQALGAAIGGEYLGTMGRVGALSFFPSKNLGAFGDGGMLVTGDAEIAEFARCLRQHGGKNKYENETIGYNSRLDTLQAAILRERLPALEANNELRRQAAMRYGELLGKVEGLCLPREQIGRHVYHQYTVRVKNGGRERLQTALAERGVTTAVYYPLAIHQLPLYHGHSMHFPQAEAAAAEVLSLPIWPGIEAETQKYVATQIRELLEAR